MRKKEVKTTTLCETKDANVLPEKYDVLPAAVALKTAAQYVRDRLGVGFEVIDLRFDKALAELRLSVEDVQDLIAELNASKSVKKAVQIQQKLAKNPFFSECDSSFSFESDTHSERFRYWHEQRELQTPFEKLKFTDVVLDAWWAANSPSPQTTTAHKTATPSTVDAAKKWLMQDPKDPAPAQPWYTAARYFARQLVNDDSTLLRKKTVLADKVSKSLSDVGIKKRGGFFPFEGSTVLKAFSNVLLG